MAGHADRIPLGRDGTCTEDDSILGKALTPRHIGAFGRKLTSTASHLIGNPINNSHYQNAMTALNNDLQHPALQRKLFAYSRASPSELLRSKLSSREIRYRALAFIPDETLSHIPEDENQYSLHQGFEASLRLRQQDENLEETGLSAAAIGMSDDAGESERSGPTFTVHQRRQNLNDTLEALSVRKQMCSSEIREIDNNVANLVSIRELVLNRLEALEVEEVHMIHDLQNVDSKLEELLEEADSVNIADIATTKHQCPALAFDPQTGHDDVEDESSFMSASIYGKLPSPKPRRRKPARRRSTAIRHEHLDPGTLITHIQAHSDSLTALDFDVPFGTMVSSALDDTVRVWDLNLGRCLGLLEGHHASVRCLQVDENLVATGSMDASIRLWDLGQIDHSTHKSSVEEITTEKRPAGASRPSSSTANCHMHTLTAHVAEITAIHLNAGVLVSGSADKTLRQWDLVKGRCVQTLDVLWAAAQASAAKVPLNSSPLEGKEQLSTYPTWPGTGTRSLDPSANFVGALQCFDAALACGTADGIVRLWDLRSGQVHRSLIGHTGAISSLQFDERKLVTGSADRSIRVRLSSLPSIPLPTPFFAAVVFGFNSNLVQIWDLRTGSIIDAYAYDKAITSMMFDQRSIVAAAGESVAKVYDQADCRHWDCGSESQMKNATIESVRVKDGYLVEGRKDGLVDIWSC